MANPEITEQDLEIIERIFDINSGDSIEITNIRGEAAKSRERERRLQQRYRKILELAANMPENGSKQSDLRALVREQYPSNLSNLAIHVLAGFRLEPQARTRGIARRGEHLRSIGYQPPQNTGFWRRLYINACYWFTRFNLRRAGRDLMFFMERERPQNQLEYLMTHDAELRIAQKEFYAAEANRRAIHPEVPVMVTDLELYETRLLNNEAETQVLENDLLAKPSEVQARQQICQQFEAVQIKLEKYDVNEYIMGCIFLLSLGYSFEDLSSMNSAEIFQFGEGLQGDILNGDRQELADFLNEIIERLLTMQIPAINPRNPSEIIENIEKICFIYHLTDKLIEISENLNIERPSKNLREQIDILKNIREIIEIFDFPGYLFDKKFAENSSATSGMSEKIGEALAKRDTLLRCAPLIFGKTLRKIATPNIARQVSEALEKANAYFTVSPRVGAKLMIEVVDKRCERVYKTIKLALTTRQPEESHETTDASEPTTVTNSASQSGSSRSISASGSGQDLPTIDDPVSQSEPVPPPATEPASLSPSGSDEVLKLEPELKPESALVAIAREAVALRTLETERKQLEEEQSQVQQTVVFAPTPKSIPKPPKLPVSQDVEPKTSEFRRCPPLPPLPPKTKSVEQSEPIATDHVQSELRQPPSNGFFIQPGQLTREEMKAAHEDEIETRRQVGKIDEAGDLTRTSSCARVPRSESCAL